MMNRNNLIIKKEKRNKIDDVNITIQVWQL